MDAHVRPASERLYLLKDDNDEIFVESPLHQHHIDGIRFLYKQFKKQKLGVIINNPLGYGNSMQVALFLGAIRHLLEKPMLILCEQSEELNWLEHFQKLTQCYNVGVAAPSPFVKKSIFINTMENLEQFCRRDWSVLVVDNDAFLKEKALQAKFKADFKIWITPLDMKDHLQMFSSIFKWIFPKEKLNIDDFKAKPEDRADAVAKSVLLDSFLEDIVCRTTLQTPFENPYEKSEELPIKTPKKNKDATGTKIKRSKRVLDTATTSTANTSQAETVGEAKKSKTDDTGTNDFNIRNIMKIIKAEDDVESFIRDVPIKFNPFKPVPKVPNNQDGKTELMEDETSFNTAEHLKKLLETEVPMEIAANPEVCFIASVLSEPDSPDDSPQLSLDGYEGETGRVTPQYMTDNLLNVIIEDIATIEDSNDAEDPFERAANILAGNNIVEPRAVEEVPENQVEEPQPLQPDFQEPANNDLDSKIKEMDERVYLKFKGSILDSLF